MPKKFAGENNKAVEARARKAAAKEAENAKKQKAAEDKEWEDNDKQIVKKQQRKDEQERKKQQLLEKKAEAKALLEQEMSSIKVAPKQPLAKITRAQIMAENEKREAAIKNINKPVSITPPLEENLNRLQIDGEVARTVDDAI
ncbi:coiled-coil domain-containing protein 124 [Ctenocephalides felis]|uniref:coiled-coil domain-containing protein 124 n=1 Tax=Ctenocephalides felis TaxID=7515 RepID=UPI000E6E269B|nr:coiled-coil domain-containing protein 124 [Ctenocephalides felis]